MNASPESRMNSAAADPEAADEIVYRAVSPGAILVLVLGLASATAFLTPLLWALPAITIGLGVYTLRRLELDADRYTGAGLATAGMLLAVLFLGWAPARYMQRMMILEARASKIAQEWADLICAGNLDEAHQWHLTASGRAPAGTSAKAFYAERPELAKLQQEFFAGGYLGNWLKRGGGNKAIYRGFVGREFTSSGENYVFEFLLRAEGQRDYPVFIVVARQPRDGGGDEMIVLNVLGLNPFIRER